MAYLITGGAGFIGSNFVKHMLNAYPNVKLVILDALTYAGNLGTLREELKNSNLTFIKGDICDKEVTEKIFKENDIQYVINFAAESHVDRSIENPQLFLEVNILGTQNLLNTAKKFWAIGTDENNYPIWKDGVKFLQVSTDEVYGSLGKDGFFTEETPLDPRSPYSAAKTGGDLIVQAYAETYKMPVNITRCSNNYGPYHFPEKLIPLIIRNILEGKKLPVYGDGTNVRDWLYVEDHCKAIDKVLHRGRVGEIYNIGGHNEKTNIGIVKLVIDTIRKIMDEKPQYRDVLKKKETTANGEIDTSWINYDLITFVRDRQGHDFRYAIDPTKISEELDWLPETMFDEGIIKTIYWYLDNQDWVEEVTSGDYMNYYEQMYSNR